MPFVRSTTPTLSTIGSWNSTSTSAQDYTSEKGVTREDVICRLCRADMLDGNLDRRNRIVSVLVLFGGATNQFLLVTKRGNKQKVQ